jgi:hypothetical protein
MDTAYLRRQAEVCLRLSQFCSDPLVIEHLRFMAAEFHTRALRAEFAAEFDPDEDQTEARPGEIRH